MFSCEFCEISKNTFLTEHLWATASVCLSSKKNVITEKRYRVKFDSIKKSLLLIKQKQKKFKNTKTYPNEIMFENQERQKCMCWHICRPFVNYLIPALCWNECNIMVLITHNYILTYTYNSDAAVGAEFISSRRRYSEKFWKILQESTCIGVSFLLSYKPLGLHRY